MQRSGELFPPIAECLHGGEEQVGSLVEQGFVGQGAGVDGDGEDASCLGGTYAEGGVLHHYALLGAEATLLHAHEVGFGVGLAMLDIEGGDHELATEDVGVVMVELVEQGVLSRAGDDEDLQPLGLELVQQLQCTGHGLGRRKGVEVVGLDFVNLLYALGALLYTSLTHAHQVDGRGACAPLVEVYLVLGEGVAIVGHGAMPCIGMVGHGVVEHAVHVEEDGTKAQG